MKQSDFIFYFCLLVLLGFNVCKYLNKTKIESLKNKVYDEKTDKWILKNMDKTVINITKSPGIYTKNMDKNDIYLFEI